MKFRILFLSVLFFSTITYANECYRIKQISPNHVIAQCSSGKYVEAYYQGRYWFVGAEKYTNKDDALRSACGCK